MGSLREQYAAQQALTAERVRQRPLLTTTNLGIAAAVVVVALLLTLVVPRLIPQSGEERYLDDREFIHNKVLLFISGLRPERVKRRLGDNSGLNADAALGVYPTFAVARMGKDFALKEEDAGIDQITTLGIEGSNPGSTRERGGTPSWEDVDGDGIRIPSNDVLFYHNASPPPAVDHWNTTTVERDGIAYVVDSRDWFINFDVMLKRTYIDKIPASASPDNSVEGKGSYSWYVNEDLEIKSVLYTKPVPENDGFQGVYP